MKTTIYLTRKALKTPVKTGKEMQGCISYDIEEALKNLKRGKTKQVITLVLTTDHHPKKGG